MVQKWHPPYKHRGGDIFAGGFFTFLKTDDIYTPILLVFSRLTTKVLVVVFVVFLLVPIGRASSRPPSTGAARTGANLHCPLFSFPVQGYAAQRPLQERKKGKGMDDPRAERATTLPKAINYYPAPRARAQAHKKKRRARRHPHLAFAYLIQREARETRGHPHHLAVVVF